MTEITALPVDRDEDGYWTHPHYYDGEESQAAYDKWLAAHNLEWRHTALEWDEAARDISDRYHAGDINISDWEPKKPIVGDGWFIGSIHDTEDGPYCVWLRKVAV